MRNLAAAFALALLCACAGSYTNGNQTAGGPDGNVSNANPDGGDGGNPDGGDGGQDAGPDAGCEARSLNGSAVDYCLGGNPSPNGTLTTVSGSISGPAQGCAVQINLATATSPCVGVANRGTLDAFDGGCTNLSSCSAPSLPGTITCITSTGTCTIVICDGGTCP